MRTPYAAATTRKQLEAKLEHTCGHAYVGEERMRRDGPLRPKHHAVHALVAERRQRQAGGRHGAPWAHGNHHGVSWQQLPVNHDACSRQPPTCHPCGPMRQAGERYVVLQRPAHGRHERVKTRQNLPSASTIAIMIYAALQHVHGDEASSRTRRRGAI
jgi:hypothetical protein